MPQADEWWASSPLAKKELPSAPPSARVKTTKDDQVAIAKYRDAADAADAVIRNAREFESRDQRFGTGATKAALFGAMYPDTDGWLGGLKSAGGALLRETVGRLVGDNQDHADYQYLNSRASGINNASLRLEKGVQTKSDEQRIARENVGVDKPHAVNHDIIQNNLAAAAVARARDQSASKWIANYGSLGGTRNERGQTYEEAWETDFKPRSQPRSAPPSTRRGAQGWSVRRLP